MNNESLIWDRLRSWCNSQNAVAGIMANLQAESAYKASNLQNTYNAKLGLSDEQYTQAVDNGEYERGRFVNDSAGYGLAQWTHWSRKSLMYDFMTERGYSIGSLEGQLSFLEFELKKSYAKTLQAAMDAGSPEEAATIILKQYEKPADQSPAACDRRGRLAREIYNKYANSNRPGADTIKVYLCQIREKLDAIEKYL